MKTTRPQWLRPQRRFTALAVLAAALGASLLLSACGGQVKATASPTTSSAAMHPTALRPLLTIRPAHLFSGFFFASGCVYWAELTTRPDGCCGHASAYRFDPGARGTTRLRHLDRILGDVDVEAVGFAPGRFVVLGEQVVWRGKEGEDGFRGVLAQPLYVGSLTGHALRPVGPMSFAVVANGAVMSRSNLQLSHDAALWMDLRLRLAKAPLPPSGSERFPSVSKGGRGGLWAYVFATERASRVPGCSGYQAARALLAGHTAFWPSGRQADCGPVVSYDLLSNVRSIVPGSEGLRLVADDFHRSVAASNDIVVWTARRASRTTLQGVDLRSGRPIPQLPTAARPTDPVIVGDVVAWLDHRQGGARAVYGLDLRSGREFAIALDRSSKEGLAADNDCLYWWNTAPGAKGDHIRLFGVRLTRSSGSLGVAPLR